MAILIDSEIYDVYEKLEYNFLYESDLNSIHILLNLYDLEKNIKNIYPKYISKRKLSDKIAKTLGKDFKNLDIANRLSENIHEDINRLELYMYLEGYRRGYFNIYFSNKLEEITINNYLTYNLYKYSYLYHFDTDLEEIYKLRETLNREIESGSDYNFINKVTSDYYKEIIKSKLYSILKNIEEFNIDVDNINRKIYNLILKDIVKIYKKSYWFGLNDRVLKRYK